MGGFDRQPLAAQLIPCRKATDACLVKIQRRNEAGAARYGDGVADNEAMNFDGGPASASRFPRSVYEVGQEPDPLYSLANERTYLAWLRFAVTLLAGAVAIDRLFLEHPRFGSGSLALGLVGLAFGSCGLGVGRWWASELALRRRRPLPGFGVPLLVALAILLAGVGVIVLVLFPSN